MERINECDELLLESGGSVFESSETTIDPKKRKVKATTSECWKFFTKIAPDKDGKEKARCNACKTEYRIGGHNYGTSHLKRHIEKCKEIKFEDVGQMIIDMKGKLKSRMIDQMVSREMCASASAFSIGSRILNKYRSRIFSKNMEALFCTRNWLHGFSNDEEEVDDGGGGGGDDERVSISVSRGPSNVDLEEAEFD